MCLCRWASGPYTTEDNGRCSTSPWLTLGHDSKYATHYLSTWDRDSGHNVRREGIEPPLPKHLFYRQNGGPPPTTHVFTVELSSVLVRFNLHLAALIVNLSGIWVPPPVTLVPKTSGLTFFLMPVIQIFYSCDELNPRCVCDLHQTLYQVLTVCKVQLHTCCEF